MSALTELLQKFRQASQSEREKGNYFEKLVKVYLQNEPCYKDLFNGRVYLWEEWRKHWMSLGNSNPGSDAGIDLVAVEDVQDNPRIFAIQAKFYAEDAKLTKGSGIDSFLSALGKQPFTDGMLFLTAYEASGHVIEAVQGRDKQVTTVDLFALENSKIDWSNYLAQIELNSNNQTMQFKESKTVRSYPVGFAGGATEIAAFTDADYYVTQIKFAKGAGKTPADKHDKTRVIYNHKITMEGIPLEAYEYVVNGKPALEWVMERQAVTTHKESQIMNDANLWATETMGDAASPLKLFQRVITVSLETVGIVKALPRLDI